MYKVYKTSGYVLKENLENIDYERYDKEDSPLHISSRGRPYRVGNDPFLKQVREVAFPAVFDSGYSVAGHIYTLTSEVKKKLQTVFYLDMLPDDLLDAIYFNPAAAGNKQVNPHTGTTVIIGTDHMIVDVALSEQSNLPQPPALLFPEVQEKQAGSAPIQIVTYGGYVVQAGMGSAFSGEETINEIKFAEDGFPTDLEALKLHAPFPIPKDAKGIAQIKKAGYLQVQFKWKTADGKYSYEIRWHTRTPGAPKYQGNTWVVERRTHGNPDNQQSYEHILLSNGQWITRYQWEQAGTARRNGIATDDQNAILTLGHWPAP